MSDRKDKSKKSSTPALHDATFRQFLTHPEIARDFMELHLPTELRAVLIEHQSSPDKHMAFRLIRYAVAAMQRHLEAGHKKLPLVIPVLFYVGKRSPYPHSTRWLDEFDASSLAAKFYSGAFPLVDVTVISDDEIMNHRSMAALTLLQKHIHQRDIATLTDQLATLLMEDYLSSWQVMALIHYLIQAGDRSLCSGTGTACAATRRRTDDYRTAA